jgi:flagellar motor protein MotB
MSLNYKDFEIEPKPETNAWLLSFADLIALLLCFFILIYTFSDPQQNKYSEIKNALSTKKETLPDYMPTTPEPEYLEGLLNNIIRTNNLSDEIKIITKNKTLYISIEYTNNVASNMPKKYNVFFDSFFQLINAINNQIEIAYINDNAQQKENVTKNVSKILREKGYSKQILEFYGSAFININNSIDSENSFEQNRLLILIHPYEVFK